MNVGNSRKNSTTWHFTLKKINVSDFLLKMSSFYLIRFSLHLTRIIFISIAVLMCYVQIQNFFLLVVFVCDAQNTQNKYVTWWFGSCKVSLLAVDGAANVYVKIWAYTICVRLFLILELHIHPLSLTHCRAFKIHAMIYMLLTQRHHAIKSNDTCKVCEFSCLSLSVYLFFVHLFRSY